MKTFVVLVVVLSLCILHVRAQEQTKPARVSLGSLRRVRSAIPDFPPADGVLRQSTTSPNQKSVDTCSQVTNPLNLVTVIISIIGDVTTGVYRFLNGDIVGTYSYVTNIGLVILQYIFG